MENGIEIFFLESGTQEEMFCKVCSSKCDVRRDVYGPTSMAAAMGKKKTVHDVFTCPHAEEAWHDQALALQKAIAGMPSKTVAGLMRQDLAELLDEQELDLDQ